MPGRTQKSDSELAVGIRRAAGSGCTHAKKPTNQQTKSGTLRTKKKRCCFCYCFCLRFCQFSQHVNGGGFLYTSLTKKNHVRCELRLRTHTQKNIIMSVNMNGNAMQISRCAQSKTANYLIYKHGDAARAQMRKNKLSSKRCQRDTRRVYQGERTTHKKRNSQVNNKRGATWATTGELLHSKTHFF